MGRKKLFKFATATRCAFDAIGRGDKKDFAGFTAITACVFENRHIRTPLVIMDGSVDMHQLLCEALLQPAEYSDVF